MKRKISIFLCVLVAVCSLVGCSGASAGKENLDTKAMQTTAETLVTSFSQMDAESFEQLKSLEKLSDFQLEVQMLNLGLNVTGENFLNILRSWEAAEAECGEFVENGSYNTEVKSKEVVISTMAQFKERKATIAFSFDKNGMLESMDVSAKYSLSEILTKAGLNTLLGMGVVFAVLIFLAAIIWLMKYIPNLLDLVSRLFKKKDKSTKQIPVKDDAVIAAVAAAIDASETDDLELVAVITAAIAMQEGTSPDGFIVRSIRRRPSNNWK